MAGVGARYYSRRQRKDTSHERFPAGRSRTPTEAGPWRFAGPAKAGPYVPTLEPDPTYEEHESNEEFVLFPTFALRG